MLRVDYKKCGKVVIEQVLWSTGKSPVTKGHLEKLEFSFEDNEHKNQKAQHT